MPNTARPFTPADVCEVSVSPDLARLFWLNEREEALIEYVAWLLNPACDGTLALVAVKARFAAVAEWATRTECLASVPQDLSDDAVLRALAHAPLHFVEGAYRFDPREFGAALRAAAESRDLTAASLHLH